MLSTLCPVLKWKFLVFTLCWICPYWNASFTGGIDEPWFTERASGAVGGGWKGYAPPWNETAFFIFSFKFVFLATQICHFLVVHTLLWKILDPPLGTKSSFRVKGGRMYLQFVGYWESKTLTHSHNYCVGISVICACYSKHNELRHISG